MRRKFRSQLERDALLGRTDAKAGKLVNYRFDEEWRVWLKMESVGRERFVE